MDFFVKDIFKKYAKLTHRENKIYLGHTGIPGLWTQELDAGL